MIATFRFRIWSLQVGLGESQNFHHITMPVLCLFRKKPSRFACVQTMKKKHVRNKDLEIIVYYIDVVKD